MARSLNRLSAPALKSSVPGTYAEGGGLWFHKRLDGGAQWFLRVHVHGRRREMGLGSYPAVSLKEAREQSRSTAHRCGKALTRSSSANARRARRSAGCISSMTWPWMPLKAARPS
ncbi:Arm DNA-binding domain-containing protein [Sulfitobacter sp. LCG007]